MASEQSAQVDGRVVSMPHLGLALDGLAELSVVSDDDEREVVGNMADGAVEAVSSFSLSALLEREDVWVTAEEGEAQPEPYRRERNNGDQKRHQQRDDKL